MSINAFLSFSQADKDIAKRMQDALGAIGIEARTDADVPAGSDWGDHLRAAMDLADGIVFFITPSALASAYVMSEVGAAIAAGKTIVPITTGRNLPPGLPAPLRKWRFIRAVNRDPNEVAMEIRDRLQHLPAAAAE